jgi:general secretion pathway protein G
MDTSDYDCNAGRQAGFTLIEVMVVVVILAALAFMVVPHLMDVPDRMNAKIAIADMKSIDTALKVYRLENRSYPMSLGALMKVPAVVKGRKMAYLENEPKDPWGMWYQYKYPGTRSRLGYDLYSAGANGTPEDGAGDDIANWTEPE